MLMGNPNKFRNMLIRQPVIQNLAVPPVPDQTQGPQMPQLMTYGRLTDTQQSGQVTDTHLFLTQGNQNIQPSRVGQGLEDLA